MAYNIKRTNGDAILVQPGTVDGPTNANGQARTDLDLYGQGTLNWGIGVDQNQVRLLENWACGAIQTGTVNNEPTWRPKNESEIGSEGAGINQPSIGQTWYNTDNNKLYVCSAVTNNPNDATWKTAGADPDLFVPAKGGTFTGNIEIAKTLPTLQLTSTDGSDMRFEMRDPSLKMLLAVDQTTYPAGATDHPYTDGATTEIKEVDTIILRKAVGGTTVNEMRMRDDYIEFLGGTFNIAGAAAGKVRTPATVVDDHDNVVTTKGFVDDEFLSKHGQSSGSVMDGNLRIEKISPQIAIEAFKDPSSDLPNNSIGAIYFDHTDVPQGRIASVVTDTAQYMSIRKQTDNTTITNDIQIHDNKIVTFGQSGKIWTDNTVVGDDEHVLTTKSYVDAVKTDLVDNYARNSGDVLSGVYKFGVDFDDVVISNSQLVSTNLQGVRSTLDGDVVTLERGTSLGVVDALGATWNTTGDADTFTRITDGTLVVQHAADYRFSADGAVMRSLFGAQDTVIKGNNIKSTTNVDETTKLTTEIEGSEIKSTNTDGYTVINGGQIASYVSDNATGANIRLSGPNGNSAHDPSITFHTGVLLDLTTRRAEVTLDTDVAFDGNPNTRNQLRISVYDDQGLSKRLQQIVMDQFGTAFRGSTDAAGTKGGMILLQQQSETESQPWGMKFQTINPGAPSLSTEYHTRAYMSYNLAPTGHVLDITKYDDNTTTQARSRFRLGDDISSWGFISSGGELTSGVSVVPGTATIVASQLVVPSGTIHLQFAGSNTNPDGEATAMRVFKQIAPPTAGESRDGDLWFSPYNSGNDARLRLAHTDENGTPRWANINLADSFNR